MISLECLIENNFHSLSPNYYFIDHRKIILKTITMKMSLLGPAVELGGVLAPWPTHKVQGVHPPEESTPSSGSGVQLRGESGPKNWLEVQPADLNRKADDVRGVQLKGELGPISGPGVRPKGETCTRSRTGVQLRGESSSAPAFSLEDTILSMDSGW